jgi:hypothetical protein
MVYCPEVSTLREAGEIVRKEGSSLLCLGLVFILSINTLLNLSRNISGINFQISYPYYPASASSYV